jgi:hypothetical protein
LVTAIDSAVDSYITALINDETIGNVDDNHELIVIVFLDPSVPVVPNPSTSSGTIGGDNAKIEIFEFLDDNIRFERCWIDTASNHLADVTRTLSHELAEAISDPFNNGWYQTVPPPAPGSGQISDVCGQPAICDGVAVEAYWSVADKACIVPAKGSHRLSLSSSSDKIESRDSPDLAALIDLGSLCGGPRMFHYLERTYTHDLTIDAMISGYESPIADWTINGIPVPLLDGSIQVPATWDEPGAVGPAPGSVAQFSPFKVNLLRPDSAELRTMRTSSAVTQIRIDVGPNSGNVSLRVAVRVRESFDSGSGYGTTLRSAVLDFEVKCQEVIWSEEYKTAHAHCEYVKHLSVGPDNVFGPPSPGDPARLDDRLANALRELRLAELNVAEIAALVEDNRPELAAALRSFVRQNP